MVAHEIANLVVPGSNPGCSSPFARSISLQMSSCRGSRRLPFDVLDQSADIKTLGFRSLGANSSSNRVTIFDFLFASSSRLSRHKSQESTFDVILYLRHVARSVLANCPVMATQSLFHCSLLMTLHWHDYIVQPSSSHLVSRGAVSSFYSMLKSLPLTAFRACR